MEELVSVWGTFDWVERILLLIRAIGFEGSCSRTQVLIQWQMSMEDTGKQFNAV